MLNGALSVHCLFGWLIFKNRLLTFFFLNVMAGHEQQFCLELLQIPQGFVVHDMYSVLVLRVDGASVHAVVVILVLHFRELHELDTVDLGKRKPSPELPEKGKLYFASPNGPHSRLLLLHSGLPAWSCRWAECIKRYRQRRRY